MKVSQQKQQLPILLLKMYHKRSALLLQRMFLYEPAPQCESQVRHYDYECEATEMLIDFFKKKHQAILIRAFNSIRIAPILKQKRETPCDRKIWNGQTKRSNLNTTFAASDPNLIKCFGLNVKSHVRNENNQNTPIQSKTKEPSKLRGILQKLKIANAAHNSFNFTWFKTEQEPSRDNASFCFANSRSREILMRNMTSPSANEYQLDYRQVKTHKGGYRNSRRSFILNKFCRIEGSISELCNDQGTKEVSINEEIQNQIEIMRSKLKYSTNKQ